MEIGKPASFQTISDIESHTFVGNHASDHIAFDEIDRFAKNENNSIQDRARALQIMYTRGMGLESDSGTDQEVVQKYLAES